MSNTDDFRLHAHELMVDLDAATTEMMKLISARQLSGSEWERVTQWQHEAYERWMAFLNKRTYPDQPQNNASH